MSDIIIVVTGAHDIKSANTTLLRERYIEYMIALHKVFSYGKPVYGVLSEYNEKQVNIPPFDGFTITKLLKLVDTDLTHYNTKSQKESYSINLLIKDIDINDDTFVIKVSGRYVIIKDTFYNTVESLKTNMNVNGIICITEGVYPLQQYTFLYALRWKWFKKFYSESISNLEGHCVERFIVEFFEKENIIGSIVNVSKLDILTNINSENKFELY